MTLGICMQAHHKWHRRSYLNIEGAGRCAVLARHSGSERAESFCTFLSHGPCQQGLSLPSLSSLMAFGHCYQCC